MVYAHIASFLALGLCFELPELALNLSCFYLARNADAVVHNRTLLERIFSIRYVLTHFVAPGCGMVAMATGVILVHIKGYSFQEGWVFWILVLSAVGLYKGLMQHNAYIRHVRAALDVEPVPAGNIKRMIASPFDQALIFLELPTYVCSYYAASVKLHVYNPFAPAIAFMETIAPNPYWMAMAIMAMTVVVTIPLRMGMSAWGVTKKQAIGP